MKLGATLGTKSGSQWDSSEHQKFTGEEDVLCVSPSQRSLSGDVPKGAGLVVPRRKNTQDTVRSSLIPAHFC